MTSDSSLSGYRVYLAQDLVLSTWSGNEFPIQFDNCRHICPTPTLAPEDSMNINVLELWLVLVGLDRWCHILKDTTLRVRVANTQVKHIC